MSGRGLVLRLPVIGGGTVELAPALADQECSLCPFPAAIAIELDDPSTGTYSERVLCGACLADALR